MNEETVFIEMDLSDFGPDWRWHGDLNVVALRAGMDCQGKLAAMDDLMRTWRRAHLSLVASN